MSLGTRRGIATSVATPESDQVLRSRIATLLWWLVPVAFLLWVYRYGLKCWFMADDFAWLSLSQQIYNFRDFIRVMFEPMAQGTIRPWSERGFFMLLRALFGLDGLPFRICVFATMAANLVLLSAVTHRITGSRLAGFAAPVLWTANAALVTVMTWNSSYNEALCALFLLGALWFWIRWTETGRKEFYWYQLAIFVLGFGALETNIVYPAIAAAYALFAAPWERRRDLLRSTVPLFAISAVYYAVHWAVAPLLRTGPYALHFDRRLVPIFFRYWKWSILPGIWDDLGRNHRLGQAIFWTVSAALMVFVIRQTARRNFTPLFFLSWFVVTLGPVIPLTDHVSDYYLTLPLIGLAMLGGYGVAKAWQSNWQLRAVAAIAAVAYLAAMVPGARFSTRWWFERTRNVRGMVLGVEAAHQSHPGKAILLSEVTSELYDDAVGHSPFILLGLNNVYLTPESKDKIHPENDLADLDDTVLPAGPTLRALANDQLVIYSLAGDHLRNITGVYERVVPHQLRDENPRRVDVGNSLFAYLLGPTWHALEVNYRWMPKRATVRLGGPRSTQERLYLEGVCPEAQLRNGPIRLSVSIDGTPLGGTQIVAPEVNFHRLFNMPATLIGRETVEVALEVSRVLRSGADEYGLVFGKIGIRQP